MTKLEPYELNGIWRGNDAPPKLIGIRTKAGGEVGVRVGDKRVSRLPQETTLEMVHRAAAAHGTADLYTLLYEGADA